MSDFRNQCRKFLSAECPNNCHYTDWCKHHDSLHNYIMLELAIKKIEVMVGKES